MECSEAELVISIWDLPVTDMHGTRIRILFYLIRGIGFLLLCNEILYKSRLLGPGQALVISAGACGLSHKEVFLQTYSEQIIPADTDAERAYLFVVPSKIPSFKTYFQSFRSLTSVSIARPFGRTQFMDGNEVKKFAL